MTPTTIMQIALRRVGLDSAATEYVNNARQYLNLVKDDICGMARWAWLYRDGSITVANGTRAYSLASDVLFPVSFRDVTNDKPLEVWTPDMADRRDPNNNESGLPAVVTVTGTNATTGHWSVDLIPTPTASGTVGYRYYSFIADFTSSNDATDLAPKFPLWVQPALVWGVSAYYKEEKENDSAADDWNRYNAVMSKALMINGASSGEVRDRMQRPQSRIGQIVFTPTEGSIV